MNQKAWMITGASRGLGAEIAKAVLAAGDQLIATARDAQALVHLGSHGNVIAVTMDVTNEAQVKSVGKTRVSAVERNHQQAIRSSWPRPSSNLPMRMIRRCGCR